MKMRNETCCSRAVVLLFALAVFWLARPATASPVTFCLEGERCPVCGDGICDVDEFCPQDCDPFAAVCGNGICDGVETCSSCPGDCGSCPAPVCGNGVCQAGESCLSCPGDCGVCPPPVVCGNGICQTGETCSTCAADCGVCPPPPPIFCGNGVCEAGETCTSCAADCGACHPGCNPPQACKPVCGNFICEVGETCSSCAVDCGACVGLPICGDGVCDQAAESCNFCSVDCCPGGGGEDQTCFTNSTCFGWGGFKCDRDTHKCCDINDSTCNPFLD
jgi:hypothetical protein